MNEAGEINLPEEADRSNENKFVMLIWLVEMKGAGVELYTGQCVDYWWACRHR